MREHEDRVGFQLKSLSNLIKRYFARSVPPNGDKKEITSTQFAVLLFLRKREKQGNAPVFQKDVEKALDVRSPTATNILQTLERRGLIRREAVPGDMRLKRVMLTEEAREMHKRHEQVALDLDELLIRDVPKEDLAAFYRVVNQATDNIRQYLSAERD